MMRGSVGILPGTATLRRRRRSGADARIVVDGAIRLGDILVIVASGLLAATWRFDGMGTPQVALSALIIGVLLAANILPLLKIYDFERLTSLTYQLPRLLGGWICSIGGVLAVLFATKDADELSRLWVGYWLVAGCGGFILWRIAIKLGIERAQARGRLCRRLVLVGEERADPLVHGPHRGERQPEPADRRRPRHRRQSKRGSAKTSSASPASVNLRPHCARSMRTRSSWHFRSAGPARSCRCSSGSSTCRSR